MTVKEGGDWHDFNIDLREYQGQDIYVAILHTNCTNQFMVNIDDIVLYREYNSSWSANKSTVLSYNIYPNPAADMLMVESDINVNRYELYNLAGTMIQSKWIDAQKFSVDVRKLPAGAYLLKLTSDGMVQTQRFVKK
jgi:hypothetical protein